MSSNGLIFISYTDLQCISLLLTVGTEEPLSSFPCYDGDLADLLKGRELDRVSFFQPQIKPVFLTFDNRNSGVLHMRYN